MKKLLILTIALTPLLFAGFAEAGSNWEVRRLKNGTCGVAKLKPGIKPGSNRVAGPFLTKVAASKELSRLKRTPRCKRF